MDPLRTKILGPSISPRVKCAIVNAVWKCNLSPSDFLCGTKMDSYFRTYESHCQPALRGGGNSTLLETYGDIVDIIQLLRDLDVDRAMLKNRLRDDFLAVNRTFDDESLDNSIDLAIRLWLMIPVGGFSHAVVPGQTVVAWSSGSIYFMLHDYFKEKALLDGQVKLGKIFKAINLEQIAGIRIIWTDNLADHLRMRDDDSAVCVFYHARFLRYHQLYETQTNAAKVFPPGFLEETLRTLALLLPQHDTSTMKWYQRYRQKLFLDSTAIKCGQLNSEDRQVEKFRYWHDRLVILKQIFDDAEPSTVTQWWRDRRKRVQWYTFWVAAMVLALTIFFGLIQSIEGAMQVYKTYYP